MSKLAPSKLDLSTLIKNFNSFDGLKVAIKNPLISDELKDVEARYRDVNLGLVLENLEAVPRFLLTAYAASKGCDSSVKVAELITSYLPMVSSIRLTCRDFMLTSVNAIELYSLALRLINDPDENERDVDGAMEMITEVQEIAHRMAENANGMVVNAKHVYGIADDALKSSLEENNNFIEKAKENENKKTNLNAEIDKQKAGRAALQKHLVYREKREQKAEKQKDDAGEDLSKIPKMIRQTRRRGFWIFSMKFECDVANPEYTTKEYLYTEAKKEAEKAHQELMQMQKQELESNADLAHLLGLLKGAVDEDNTLMQTILSLEMAVQILGKIVVVTERVQTYWTQIEKECQYLSRKPQDVMKRKLKLLNYWIESGWYNWLAFAKMNHTALNGMGIVVEKVQEVLNDLPTTQEAKDRFQQLAADMDKMLIDDKLKLLKSTEELKKNPAGVDEETQKVIDIETA